MRSAIIDIGYNAIRAVVYERDTIGSPEIFNDKFRNDILSLLEMENLDVKHQTYLSLKYLVHIFEQLSVTNIRCVATAVLRGHPKAVQFQQIIKEKFKFDIEVISGDKEAYLTAAGLISGVTDACGVAADLGGGSLEIASIADRKVGNLKSLPLGTKVIVDNNLNDVNVIIDIIKKEFGQVTYQNLYLIGGAFRFIGRFYMDFIHYPLKNLHNLEIPRRDFELYLEKLDHLNRTQLSFSNQGNRNIDSNAILVAKAMMHVFTPEKVVISNYGLKEGVRFVSLPEEEQKKDTIYERIKALVHLDENVCKLDRYKQSVLPLLVNADKIITDIIELAFSLAQFNKNIDKTLRANFAVEFVLSSDIPFSHRQRVMLGLILSFAYSAKSDNYINKLAKKTISRADYANSQIIGNFIKIARKVDGPEFHTPSFSLNLKDNYIEISTAEILPRPVFEKVCEYLKDIAYARKVARNS